MPHPSSHARGLAGAAAGFRGGHRGARCGRELDKQRLSASVEATQDAWTGSGRSSAPSSTNPLLMAVPPDLLESDVTTEDTLNEYSRQRAINFGERSSRQVLRFKLMIFNADTDTVWTTSTTSLPVLMRGQLQMNRGAEALFQAAIWHPFDVPVDGESCRNERENLWRPASDMGRLSRAGAVRRPSLSASRRRFPCPSSRPPSAPSQRRPTSRGLSPVWYGPSGGTSCGFPDAVGW